VRQPPHPLWKKAELAISFHFKVLGHNKRRHPVAAAGGGGGRKVNAGNVPSAATERKRRILYGPLGGE